MSPELQTQISSLAKIIGLICAGLLGIVGTFTDTKEKLPDGGYKVRTLGWLVAALIAVSSIIGGIGQHYEDRAKEREEQEQLDRLRDILERFSGNVSVVLRVSVATDQPQLRGIMRQFDRRYPVTKTSLPDGRVVIETSMPMNAYEMAFWDELRHIRCSVTLLANHIEHRGQDAFSIGDLRAESQADLEIFPGQDKHSLVAALHMHAAHVESQGVFSASDFGGRRINVECYDSKLKMPLPDWFDAREKLEFAVDSLTIRDEELHTELTRATLSRVPGNRFPPLYLGTTKELFAVPTRN